LLLRANIDAVYVCGRLKLLYESHPYTEVHFTNSGESDILSIPSVTPERRIFFPDSTQAPPGSSAIINALG